MRIILIYVKNALWCCSGFINVHNQ